MGISNRNGLILLAALVWLVFLGLGCSVKEISTRVGQSVRKGKTETAKPAAIRNPLDRKQLVVLFDGSPYSYAVVGGSPQGLEYELLQLFAQDQGLELLIKVIQDENHLLDSLRAGVGDLAASNLNPTPQRETIVDFAEPLLTADHRLIQRCCTQNPQRLNGKTVVIRRNSSFKQTAAQLYSGCSSLLCSQTRS